MFRPTIIVFALIAFLTGCNEIPKEPTVEDPSVLTYGNPLTLRASFPDTVVDFHKEATNPQRIVLEKGSTAYQVDIPHPPIRLSRGDWTVTHYTRIGLTWVKGRGRTSDNMFLAFDDNPTGGDNDFNDALVFVR